MSNNKIAELTVLLHKKTESGEVRWEETEHDNMFQTSFPNYSVRIMSRDSFDHPGEIDYLIQIINSYGKVVDEVSDIELRDSIEEPYEKMGQIYSIARRQALGIDEALDSILNALNKA